MLFLLYFHSVLCFTFYCIACSISVADCMSRFTRYHEIMTADAIWRCVGTPLQMAIASQQQLDDGPERKNLDRQCIASNSSTTGSASKTSRCSSTVLALPALSRSCSYFNRPGLILVPICRDVDRSSPSVLCAYIVYDYCCMFDYHIEATTRVQFSLPISLVLFTPHLFTHKRGRLSWAGGIVVSLVFNIQNSISISSSSARTFQLGYRPFLLIRSE